MLQSLEETHALSAQRKAILDELWEELQKACILSSSLGSTHRHSATFLQETRQYKQNTEEKKVQFEQLKAKDELSAKEIARQMKRLKKLQVSGNHVTCTCTLF